MAFTAGLVVFGLLAHTWPLSASAQQSSSCLNVQKGYTCEPSFTHHWGQYSPYFAVHSPISNDVPDGCTITFAQVIARHGARFPTSSKTVPYKALVAQIQTNVDPSDFVGKYAFLENYNYTLGSDTLTTFGQQQMFDAGVQFYDRYKKLARKNVPFFRVSGEDRVIMSGMNFSQGYHATKKADNSAQHGAKFPYPLLEIVESDTSNNTLSVDTCTAFNDGPTGDTGTTAQTTYTDTWVPPIRDRLNAALPGAGLNSTQVIYLMDLCTFDTVASDGGAEISPFCGLFSKAEFLKYNYYQTLGKWYGYGPGNYFGPSMGAGFVNELIARMTNSPVHDHTSVNHTLDDSSDTFPLDKPLYADFSHDNDMTSIIGALGLYNHTKPLSNTTLETDKEAGGYSAAWTVPYGGRFFFEKMQCGAHKDELVRVLINNRVVPPVNCGADHLGRCKLGEFVKSLSLARHGGIWEQCFE